MVDPFFTPKPDVLRLAAPEPLAGHELIGRVIRGQAAQISELQNALLEVRRQLAEHELGAAHEPVADDGLGDVVVSEPSCLTVDVSHLKPGEFATVHPKPGQSIKVVGGSITLADYSERNAAAIQQSWLMEF